MKGKSLSNSKAKQVVEARQQQSPYKLLYSEMDEVGQGNLWDEASVDQAVEKLVALKDDLIAQGRPLDVNTFDKDAGVILHGALRLPPNLAAQDGFWRWLAVERFPDVVEARARSQRAHLRNYGIDASMTANRIAILWYRAEMVYDGECTDPYHLARQPAHEDFWESGIIRHRYAWSSNLARSLVRFQYRNRSSSQAFLHSTHQEGIRELYKRLRRLHSTISFEYLNDEELWAILEKKSSDLKRA